MLFFYGSFCVFCCQWRIFLKLFLFDLRFHLQAFRHLYVLAVEKRLIIPRDVSTNKACYVELEIVYKVCNTSKSVYTTTILYTVQFIQKKIAVAFLHMTLYDELWHFYSIALKVLYLFVWKWYIYCLKALCKQGGKDNCGSCDNGFYRMVDQLKLWLHICFLNWIFCQK